MRTRRYIWTGSGLAVATLIAAVGLTARGQDRPVAEPKYYQGKVSPPAPGMFPATYVRPNGQPGAKQPTGQPARPALQYPNTPTGTNVVPAGGPQRITLPVVAGPDGVRQVSAMEPVSATPGSAPVGSPVIPPRPASDKPMAGGQLPPPSVNLETYTPAEATNPRPLALTAPPTSEVQPVGDQIPTASPPPVPGGVPFPPPPPATFPALPTPGLMPVPSASGTTPPKPLTTEQPNQLMASTSAPGRQAPNLTVDVVVPESVGVGQPLTYELVIRNVGTSTVHQVKVEDELPTRSAFVSSDPAAESSGEKLSWTIGTMEPGIEKRIKVIVKPGEEGELRSRAMVTFTTAIESRVKVTRPRVTVAMSNPESMRVGEKIPFTIKLTNSGSGPATKVMLQARFTDGLGHTQGQVIEAELAALPAGQTRTLSLEALGLKAGAQSCTLTATADGNVGEPAKSSITLVEPMLQAKQTGPARCLVKSEPVYQIELANPGSATTDPVQVWANLPVGFDLVQASDGGAFFEANRMVGWRVTGLPPGSTKVITMKVRAVAPTEGVIRTTATASQAAEAIQQAGGAADVRNVKGLEARTETVVKAEGVPALRFEVIDVEDPIEVGKEAIYEIRVMNQGTGPCTNVQLIADLADGTTAAGASGPTNGRASGQQIVFEPIPQFGVKAEANYKVRVKGNVAGDLRFRVRLVCDQIKVPVVKEENTRFYKE